MDEQNLDVWSFWVEEVSAGVYQARGFDAAGRTAEATGSDPDALLEDCKQAAVAVHDPPAAERPE